MKEYVGIYIKTEKAQERDGFGNKMKYHFHITTIHKYHFFVFCLYSSCVYLGFSAWNLRIEKALIGFLQTLYCSLPYWLLTFLVNTGITHHVIKNIYIY